MHTSIVKSLDGLSVLGVVAFSTQPPTALANQYATKTGGYVNRSDSYELPTANTQAFSGCIMPLSFSENREAKDVGHSSFVSGSAYGNVVPVAPVLPSAVSTKLLLSHSGEA